MSSFTSDADRNLVAMFSCAVNVAVRRSYTATPADSTPGGATTLAGVGDGDGDGSGVG